MSFILSKVLWVFISPGSLLVFLLLCGGFLGLSHNAKVQKRGHNICFAVALLFFFIGILPVGDWMLAPLENVFPPAVPEHVDGIVLLGGDEQPLVSEYRKQPSVINSASRYIAFASLSRQFPQAKLVFSGGSGRLITVAKMKDFEVAKEALAGLGVPVERMVFEDQSRNTHENATMTADLMHPTPEQNWLLVTNAFHMPRAMLCFRKAGWTVYPATAGYMTDGQFSWNVQLNLAEHLLKMTTAMREYYGLVAYWLMGYIDSPWPQS